MSEEFQKPVRDRHLVSALISAALAAILMSYVANVAKPGILHAVLALATIGATVSAYLFIARSEVDVTYKGGAVIALGIASVLYLIMMSRLL